MKRISCLLFTLLISYCIKAAAVDTITIYSTAMQKEYKCVVIQPTVLPDKNAPLPVVYLLHGHGGW
ncbi:MAG: esterase family protein, partial [Chitinophagaceae bacterium]